MLSTERTTGLQPLPRFELRPHVDVLARLLPAMTTQLPQVATIFVVGGTAGSGKTTVALYLSQELGVPYLEGDDVHTFCYSLPRKLFTCTVSQRSQQN
jgi:hypothetical protein